MPALCFLALLLLSLVSHSFSLPGAANGNFKNKGDTLEVKVNKLTSTKTLLPYDYYFLKYCKPPVIVNSALSLGEVLLGDRIENSVYTFKMGRDEYCKIACRVKLDADSANNFKQKINDNYRVSMTLDDLPVAVAHEMGVFRDGGQSTIYVPGFPVGVKGYYAGSSEASKFLIYNHLKFKVIYNEDLKNRSSHIVGFEVTPHSVHHEYKGWDDEKTKLMTCPNSSSFIEGGNGPQEVNFDTDKEVVFTYDIYFESSDIKWASRWGTYISGRHDEIRWFAMINSLITMLFFFGVVAMKVIRTLYKDIANYRQLETQDEAQEETGWKQVHGDVFRPPFNANLLCVCVGNGVQVFGMAIVTLCFALLGFHPSSNRGGLMAAMVLSWVFMGFIAGYSSARLHKMFKGTEWKRIALKTAFMLPAALFGIFFVLNALIKGQKSSGAVPFGTMLILVILWFGISVPLVFVGSYLGFKKPAIEDPVETNEILRQIPERSRHNLKSIVSAISGGFLPFSVVYYEFNYIWTSLCLDQVYNSFGFLCISFLIFLVTCSELAILLCYSQLRSENYHWWWRAYLTAGSSALYIFLSSIYYFITRLEIENFVPVIIYLGYMLIGSCAFFVLTGTIGFHECFWFVRKIYSSVKFD